MQSECMELNRPFVTPHVATYKTGNLRLISLLILMILMILMSSGRTSFSLRKTAFQHPNKGNSGTMRIVPYTEISSEVNLVLECSSSRVAYYV